MFELVTTRKALKEAIAALNKEVAVEPLVALDTETYSTGLATIYEFHDPYTNTIRLVQMKTRNGKTYVFDLKKLSDITELKTFLGRPDIRWVIHNAKFEYKMIKAILGVELKDMWCTYIAGTIIGYATGMSIRASSGLGLNDMARDFLGVHIDKTEQSSYWGGALTAEQLQYAAVDVLHLIPLYDILERAIREEYKCPAAMELEMQTLPVVGDMEINGIGFDVNMYELVQKCAKALLPNIIKELCAFFGMKMQRVYVPEKRKFDLVPTGVNLNSREDMLKAFAMKGIELPDLTADTLRGFSEIFEIVKVYMNYKMITKQLSTDYKAYIHPLTGRIHATFSQAGAATGRFSSKEPNLQQVPKIDIEVPDYLVDPAWGKKYFDKNKGKYFLNYRYCFVAAEGKFMASSDFGGQETSIIAVKSMDRNLIAILNRPEKVLLNGEWIENPDADLHSQVAAMVFGIDPTKSREKNPAWNGQTWRGAAKSITFGLAYGQTEHALAESLGVPAEEARAIIDRYFRPMPQLKRWLEAIARLGEKTRLSVFDLGRTRFLNDSRHTDAGAIGRAAKNTPIQGCGALMMKKALVHLKAKVDELVGAGLDVQIVGTVHDEVLIEFSPPPTGLWDQSELPGNHRLHPYTPEQRYVVNAILECMDCGSHFFLNGVVPDRASCGVGHTWTK